MVKKSSNRDGHSTISIDHDLNAKIRHFKNINQNIISITEDKLELRLRDFEIQTHNKMSWTTPFGILLALLAIPLTTSNFKDTFSIPASVWQAGIYILIITSLIWLIKNAYFSFRAKKTTINTVINDLKREDVLQDQQ